MSEEVEGEQHDATADLIRAAASGDRQAAGEYFAQNLHRLSLIARKIAGTSADPGDLLGDALVSVLTKWAAGTGPTGNVNAYIAMIMRNKLLDELKSPRSQVQHLDPDYDPPADEDGRIRRVELDEEFALVRRALDDLPPDHREVLIATLIEGHKPRDLVDRLNRPASSIYSLTTRAKDNLRRTMLQILLTEDAPDDCTDAAQRLPRTVGDAPEDTPVGNGSWFEHYRTCQRCRRIWAGFGALAALGIAPLVVVSDLVAPTPASASTLDTPPSRSSTPPQPTAAPQVQQHPSASSVTNAVPWRRATGRAVDWIGPLTAAIGLGIIAILAAAFLTSTLWFAHEPTADIDVDSTWASATSSELELRFEVIDETWHTRALQIQLSSSIVNVRPPVGWQCSRTLDESTITCTTDSSNAPGGSFVLEHARTRTAPRYEILLTTTTDTGDTVIGTASGEIQH